MQQVKENWFSGEVCFWDNIKADYRAEIYIDEHNQGVITVYGVTKEDLLAAETGKYKSMVILLENKEYVSVFDLYVKEKTYNTKIVDEMSEFDDGKIVVIASIIFMGKNYFDDQETCKELMMEITDGCELIGVCPYDLNKSYLDIRSYKNIEITVQITPIHITTVVGEFWINVLPQYSWGKQSFVIGFSHNIRFKPIRALKVMEIRETLLKLTDFFAVLCGEAVTINKLSVVKTEDADNDWMECVGICNFTKEKLNIFNDFDNDTAGFKRVSLFKLSDFEDLEKVMNYWFDHYDRLFNAQKAYDRILLDEELKIATAGKFLAAMQLVEGYIQAFADEEQEIEDFQQRKQKILSMLTDEDDIELVKKGLGFSGISFRNSMKEYLYKGSSCLNEVIRKDFLVEHKRLIDRIVNDRNFYTHSSNRTTAQMHFDEMLDVTSVCKEIYRILILNEMGIPRALLMQRFFHNRKSEAVFSKVLGLELCAERELSKYDRDMWHFSD